MKVKIGNLFHIEKGTLQSSKNTPGDFNFITASSEWKTHKKYTHDCEALIFAMGASGSLGRTHYVNGKFISSDLCYILVPSDKYKKRIDLNFYHTIFNSLKNDIVKKTQTGSAKKAINIKNFKNYELPFIDYDEQKNISKKFNRILKNKISYEKEIDSEKLYLTKLKEAILQEAVQGKLVEQNSNDEPASILLEKIKKEKEQLIKNKKIKKQKPLPEISQDEIPYELPKGWEWVRLGILASFQKGFAFKSKDYKDKGKMITKIKNLSDNNTRNSVYIDENLVKNYNDYELLLGDIVLTTVGSGPNSPQSVVGTSFLINKMFSNSLLNQNAVRIRPFNSIENNFFYYILNSTFFKKYIIGVSQGTANQSSITQKSIKEYLLPLPPLEEQKRIVEKVDQLMAFCDELEQEINKSKKNAEQLMQSLLKEAFEQK